MTIANVLRLRGLPYRVTEQEIREFFNGYDVEEVYISERLGWRPSAGLAYVRLASEEQAYKAWKTLNNALLGDRYIQLFRAPDNALEEKRNKDTEVSLTIPQHFVRLIGLPYRASAADVEAFFSGVAMDNGAESVKILYHRQTLQPTGQALVQMQDMGAVQAALALDGKCIDGRYIRIRKPSDTEVYWALQKYAVTGDMNIPGIRHVARQLSIEQPSLPSGSALQVLPHRLSQGVSNSAPLTVAAALAGTLPGPGLAAAEAARDPQLAPFANAAVNPSSLLMGGGGMAAAGAAATQGRLMVPMERAHMLLQQQQLWLARQQPQILLHDALAPGYDSVSPTHPSFQFAGAPGMSAILPDLAGAGGAAYYPYMAAAASGYSPWQQFAMTNLSREGTSTLDLAHSGSGVPAGTDVVWPALGAQFAGVTGLAHMPYVGPSGLGYSLSLMQNEAARNALLSVPQDAARGGRDDSACGAQAADAAQTLLSSATLSSNPASMAQKFYSSR